MDQRLKELQEQVKEAEAKAREARQERHSRLQELVRADFPEGVEGEPIGHLSEGTWRCPDPDGGELNDPSKPSPTGRCIYNEWDYDCCIYCGYPDERK